MSEYNSTRPEDGDLPHVTWKKILQQIRVDAQAKLTEPGAIPNNPLHVVGTHDHQSPIAANQAALVTRPASSFEFDLASGAHNGHMGVVHKFGYNSAVPNGSFADVYTYGVTVATYPWPTTAQTLRARAGNAADTAGGAGARKVMILGLDNDFNEISEEITLAGGSPSAATTKTFRRVWRAYVSETGTYGVANTGQILIENTGSSAVLAGIPIGIGQTQMTHYTVPAGYTAYLNHVDAQVAAGTSKDADLRMWQRQDADVVAAPFSAKRLVLQFIALQGGGEFDFYAYVPIPAKTDIWFDAKGNGAITGVNVTYDLFLTNT